MSNPVVLGLQQHLSCFVDSESKREDDCWASQSGLITWVKICWIEMLVV